MQARFRLCLFEVGIVRICYFEGRFKVTFEATGWECFVEFHFGGKILWQLCYICIVNDVSTTMRYFISCQQLLDDKKHLIIDTYNSEATKWKMGYKMEDDPVIPIRGQIMFSLSLTTYEPVQPLRAMASLIQSSQDTVNHFVYPGSSDSTNFQN